MTLRSRMLLAFGVVVLIPLALLAFVFRHETTKQLSAEYQVRVNRVVEVIREDLRLESDGIGERLDFLKKALVEDNRFRLAAVAGLESERNYLLNYAAEAMRGLSMLQIQDADGRIISSGHFRNEHGRLDPELPAALANANDGIVLITVRTPDREFLSLARRESFQLGGRTFTLVGGVAVDQSFLARLARDPAVTVLLTYPGGMASSNSAARQEGMVPETEDAAVGTLEIPFIRTGTEAPPAIVPARLQVTQSRASLRSLQRRMDSWFLMVAVATGVTALLLALWLSSRISKPLADLAAKTAVLDLDRLDVRFEGGGTSEVRSLARLLGDLASRLRKSTARVREAERRATIGDLARQINHDIKNGLIPLRNVMRHLEQVERDDPSVLPSVFAERRQTIESSIAYLQTLATSYQRLSPGPERRNCDLNALIQDVIRAAQGQNRVEFTMNLQPHLPAVIGDPVAFRRILENLTTNAVESLGPGPGRVTVSTELMDRNGEPPLIRVTVTDTGSGMSKEETARIFNDFYTTKEGGTGLGLSIVRRLVMDIHGSIAVESEPGKGTRMIVDIPSGSLERK